jgi:hypothetical protein
MFLSLAVAFQQRIYVCKQSKSRKRNLSKKKYRINLSRILQHKKDTKNIGEMFLVFFNIKRHKKYRRNLSRILEHKKDIKNLGEMFLVFLNIKKTQKIKL